MPGGRPRGAEPSPGDTPDPVALAPVGAGADAGWHLDAG